MKCPFCNNADSNVRDSRQADDGASIRRRRECPECTARFTTFERVQLRDLTIIKSDGSRKQFDREKLIRSMSIATAKRPVATEQIEKIADSIQRQLETMGEAEITTAIVGEKVMRALAGLDQVAYVRYASVYKDFRETTDFNEFLDDLGKLRETKH